MNPVIAATDLSHRSERAVLRAAHLARALDAPLHIVHVLDEDLPGAILHRRAEEIGEILAETIAQAPILGELSPRVDVEVGHLPRLLPAIAGDRHAALLVMGPHRGRGLGELLGAPSLSRVMMAVDIPILVAAGDPERPYRDVLAGWDFSPAGRAAVDLARIVAPGAEVTLLHAWTEPGVVAGDALGMGVVPSDRARKDLEEAMEESARILSEAHDGAPFATRIVSGGATPVLLHQIDKLKPDLMVLGRHARSGIARFFLGDTAERVALSGACDVLVAPPG